MEDSQPLQSGSSAKSKLLRYALRSGSKNKEEKPTAGQISNSSVSRRVRAVSSVSQSVSVLDLSGKEKPAAKPPRRLSIPAKSAASTPASRLVGNITPISEARGKRADTLRKTDTPVSDVSRSSSRKKFSVLSSASYWLSQIKVSEAAANHSISIGFFKLALEAKCEPLQRMRDELKSYARRYNLGETVKELFESYNIVENTEQLQTSESCSQLPEGTQSSDDEVRSSTSTVACRKLKPKALNTDNTEVSTVKEPAKQSTTQSSDDDVRSSNSTVACEKLKPKASNTDNAKVSKVREPEKKNTTQKATPTTRTKASLTKKASTPKSLSDAAANKSLKKPQKPIKQEVIKVKDVKANKGKKSASEEGSVVPTPAENELQENKENMVASSMEDID
ncbi:hypothetical protein UlMin_008195 [Ulmus minor]